MTVKYHSYMVRCWNLGGREPRIEVRHVQSADRVRVASLAAAMDWIEGHNAGSIGDSGGSTEDTEGRYSNGL